MHLDEENAPSPPLLGAKAEPVFVNVYGAQESIPGLLKRFTNTGLWLGSKKLAVLTYVYNVTVLDMSKEWTEIQ